MDCDVIFVNGRIRTGDPAMQHTSAIAVRNGRIIALGTDALARSARHRIDLGGAPVVPGFHDAHFHLSGLGQQLQHCDLSPDTTTSLDALYTRLASYAAALPTDAWVIGEGFDDHVIGGMPTMSALDAITGGRPAWIVHASHHAGVANAAAFARMGHADPSRIPDVHGGIIGRDADGTANGYLAERAAVMMREAMRPEPFDRFVDAIGLGSDAALAMGITSITEPGVAGTLTGNGPDDYSAFERALQTGRLRVRATVMPELGALERGLSRARCATYEHRLRLGAVKLFADGAISARTAAMRCDYATPAGAGRGIQPDMVGLRRTITELHRDGWQVAAHAIGDAAIDAVLDAYEAALHAHPHPDPRFRIEHVELLDEAQIARMARLQVIPVLQASFITAFGHGYDEALGPERSGRLIRTRSLLDAGLVVAGSSDCPVVTGSPLRGIDAMVTRRRSDGSVHAPDERVTPAQALYAYTAGAAHAEFAEQDRGSLAIGNLADFVVLGDDPVETSSQHVGDIDVIATIVGGAVEFGDLE